MQDHKDYDMNERDLRAEMKAASVDHAKLLKAFNEAEGIILNLDHALKEAKLDNDRLRQLVQYCRMRLKQDGYREHVDKCLADLSRLDPDPEMQGKLVQSTIAGQGALK